MHMVKGTLVLEPGEADLLGRAAGSVADIAARFGGRDLPQAIQLTALSRAVAGLLHGERPPVYVMLAPASSAEARALARYLADQGDVDGGDQ